MKAGIYKRCDNGKHIYVSGSGYIRAFQLSDVHPLEDKKIKVKTRNKEAEVEFKDESGADVLAFRVADAQAPYVNDVALRKYIDANPTKLQRALQEVKGRAFNDNGGDVSAEWKAGREDKQFSRQVVYGNGPGFLTEQAAAAERWLLADIAKLDELVEQGVLSRVQDEYTVVDAERYAAFLNASREEHTDIYKQMADAVYGDKALDFKTGPRQVGRPAALAAPYGRDFTEQQERMRALGYRRCHKQSARKHRQQGHIVIAAGDGSYWWIASKAA